MMLGFAFTLVLLVALLGSPGLGQLSEINTTNSNVQQQIVDMHNEIRREISASNMLRMNWSSEISANAQKWADTCAMGHSTQSKRTVGNIICGENIYMSSHPDPWSSAINAWNSEKEFYTYSQSVNWNAVGHFTQMIWRRTNEVGCGVAHCPSNSSAQYFYVCHYSPPGNFRGQYPYKRGPHCADCPDSCEDDLCNNPCPHFDHYANCRSVVNNIGCRLSLIRAFCPASCLCKGEID
ncbi:serotriflin isoform X2 [Anguilla anguilla]|nr:serotriflin isoform X2 [Anguilla anguilla]